MNGCCNARRGKAAESLRGITFRSSHRPCSITCPIENVIAHCCDTRHKSLWQLSNGRPFSGVILLIKKAPSIKAEPESQSGGGRRGGSKVTSQATTFPIYSSVDDPLCRRAERTCFLLLTCSHCCAEGGGRGQRSPVSPPQRTCALSRLPCRRHQHAQSFCFVCPVLSLATWLLPSLPIRPGTDGYR